MCEFVSWVERYNGKPRFLTRKELATKRGVELLSWIANVEDVQGHGAIRRYYRMAEDEGHNRECTNFADSNNLPSEIVKAIKAGDMEGIGISCQLLTPEAWAKYEKVQGPAYAEYNKVQDQAWAEYSKVTQTAYAEYNKVRDPAWAKYKKVQGQAWAEYKKVQGQAYAEYKKVQGQAYAEYNKVQDQALAEYEKVRDQALAEYKKVRGQAYAEYRNVTQSAFWSLFANPDNRAEAWR